MYVLIKLIIWDFVNLLLSYYHIDTVEDVEAEAQAEQEEEKVAGPEVTEAECKRDEEASSNNPKTTAQTKKKNAEPDVSEAESKRDEEASTSNPKTTAQTKKKNASTKRLKKGAKSVEDVKS